MSVLLGLIFFLSGTCALLFETLWFFQSGLALGNSIWASSLVLASFMAGLALGNGFASAFGHRIRRPVAFYAGLEIIIGATGAGLVFLLPWLTPVLAPSLGPLIDEPWLLNSLRVAIAFVLLLIPATAMGATLPLLVSTLYAKDRRFGAVLGRLYGWNTLGAVLGAVLGEALLIGWFGVRGTALLAAGGNGLAAALALLLATQLRSAPDPQTVEERSKRLTSRAALLLASAFTLGGLLLALEVIWFRFLLLFVPGTNFAFALMLAVVLVGIGSGGFAASAFLSRRPETWRTASTLALLAGMLAAGLYATFGLYLPETGSVTALSVAQILKLALPLMLPVAILSGALFALLGEGLHREIGGETRSAGLLTLANTAGAALGSLAGGFILLPMLGIEASIRLLSAVYGIAALFTFMGGARCAGRMARGALAVAGFAFLLQVAFFPAGLLDRRFLAVSLADYVPPEIPVAKREGLNETVVTTRRDRFGEPHYYRLVTNGHSMSATSLSSLRYMKLFVYLPVALHPNPRSALLISYGVGGTARALVDTQELETIDVVDISPDILEMSRTIAEDGSESGQASVQTAPLDDERVRVHVEDGRFFLQTTDRGFDIITGEPPPPKLAGIVNLYTREYFELIRKRLNPSGIATYWLPVHALLGSDTTAILRAFCDVFEDCTLWTGAGRDWILMGSRNDGERATIERFSMQWRDPLVASELKALGLETPAQMGALFLADRDQIARMTKGVEPLVDDFPKRLSDRVGAGRYQSWMLPEKTKTRFAASRILRERFPLQWRSASLPWFEAQHDINLVFGYDEEAALREADLRQLARVHELLETTSLQTLPLWLLGSSVELQRMARGNHRRDGDDPAIDYHRAAGEFVAGNWDRAAQHLDRAARGAWAVSLLPFRAYALCRAGNIEGGTNIVRRMENAGRFTDHPEAREVLESVCQPL